MMCCEPCAGTDCRTGRQARVHRGMAADPRITMLARPFRAMLARAFRAMLARAFRAMPAAVLAGMRLARRPAMRFVRRRAALVACGFGLATGLRARVGFSVRAAPILRSMRFLSRPARATRHMRTATHATRHMRPATHAAGNMRAAAHAAGNVGAAAHRTGHMGGAHSHASARSATRRMRRWRRCRSFFTRLRPGHERECRRRRQTDQARHTLQS
jgi:hypothetical protein